MSISGARNPSLPQPPVARPAAAKPGTAGQASGGDTVTTPPVVTDSFERAQPATAGPAQATTTFGPGSGQAIQARMKPLPGHGGVRAALEFDRPLTGEQAAQVLFKGGKVPDGAKLVPGESPNVWVLETPDLETHSATMRAMSSRTETVDPGKPGEALMTWTGGANVVATGPRRLDLKNDFGFVISRHYPLDEGQIPERHVKSLVGKGTGYEVAFEQPMTQKQVLDKLFDQSLFEKGDVKLLPVGGSPSMTWQVQVVGPDALGAVRRPFDRAFSDANVHAEKSLNPGVPAGMKAHFESKTVPPGAKQVAPNTWVWEQEGHIAYVKSDGKGGYHPEFTKLHPTEEKLNKTIRYFMFEKGLPPREGWKAFSEHWDDLHRQMLMAMMGALASGRMPGGAPTVKVGSVPQARRQPSPAPQPTTIRQPPVKGGDTLRSSPPPPPVVKPSAGGGTRTQPDHGTTLTANQAQARTRTVPPGGPPAPAAPPPAPAPAGQTIDTASGPAAPPAQRRFQPGEVLVSHPPPVSKPLPDSQPITIQTSKGPQKMTVGDYRQKHAQASKWLADQRLKYHRGGQAIGSLPPNYDQLIKQAQERFGLDAGWFNLGNPYIFGRL
jgi:hypothetical protein